MGFIVEKSGFWPQNQKSTVDFQPFQLNGSWILDPRDKHTRDEEEENPSAEACCMIEDWDPKNLWKRVCMQAERKAYFALSLTDTSEFVH